MRRTPLDPALQAELAAVAEQAGCELIHLELKGAVLRLVLDKPEGVGLGDCERVSRQASALLDAFDFGVGRYTLEVSSPGLDRPLYRPADYERFLGRMARVTYQVPETGAKRTVIGRLEGFRPAADAAEVEVVDATTRQSVTIPLAAIQAARLEIET
jgi:ribosome maturation factor RimP